MVLNNLENGHFGIPVAGLLDEATGKRGIGSGDTVDIPPGYSEMPDERWASCRPNALRLIASGKVKEEWVKVDAKDAKGCLILESEDAKETSKRLVPATLADIGRNQNKVINVVKGCFHPPTLNKWYAEDTRQDVRVEIQKQMDGIEKGTIKG